MGCGVHLGIRNRGFVALDNLNGHELLKVACVVLGLRLLVVLSFDSEFFSVSELLLD